MDFIEACAILGLDANKEYTIEDLKRIYRQNALIYHPDKNPGSDTTAVFHKIQNAYEFLLIEFGYSDSDDDDIESSIDENDIYSFHNSISSKIKSYSRIT